LRRGIGKQQEGLILVENNLKNKLLISIIIFFLSVLLGILVYVYSVSEFKTSIEITPTENFDTKIGNKTVKIIGRENTNLRAGKVTIQIRKIGYDNYKQIFDIKRNNNNLIKIDMRPYKQQLDTISSIKGLDDTYKDNYNIVDTNYIEDNGTWAVVVLQNKSNKSFAIAGLKREGREWNVVFGPIINPSSLKNKQTIPESVINWISSNSIEYFGEREF
jgi:hypothetical protein